MALSLRFADSMNAAQLHPLWPSIIACLQKYCDRFPYDENVAHIIARLAAGRNQLWLTVDEQEQVVGVIITEIRNIEPTGAKRLVYTEAGGSRLDESIHLMPQIEEWARQVHNVKEFDLIGRRGWAPFVKPHGYEPEAVVYRKRDRT
jgi:hypothetical protein